MNDLEKFFRNNANGYLIDKWDHYFDAYDAHFSRYRGKKVTILEIGVSQGGSLQMWKNYFGDQATIYGLDIDERCKKFEDDKVKIFIGSQSDRKFLQSVAKQIGEPIDILIDDGGHTMKQQLVTFQEMYKHVSKNGVYLCEDTHTSYWLGYGGGYRRRGTFMEFSKKLIDSLNAYHSHQKYFRVDEMTKSMNSLHFYDSMVFIEKKEREKSHSETVGVQSFHDDPPKSNILSSSVSQIKILINKFLCALRLPGFDY